MLISGLFVCMSISYAQGYPKTALGSLRLELRMIVRDHCRCCVLIPRCLEEQLVMLTNYLSFQLPCKFIFKSKCCMNKFTTSGNKDYKNIQRIKSAKYELFNP